MLTGHLELEKLRGILGEPAVSGESYMIYSGDCIKLMRELPPSLIPLTITSPPYNIGKAYEQPLPTSTYLQWCVDWIAEIHRLTTAAGALWLNLGYIALPEKAKAIPLPYLLWDRIPFFMLQEIVWQYGAGVAAKMTFSPRNEKFLWYVKNPDLYSFDLDAVRDPDVKYPNQKKNGKLKCNPLGKNPGDVWAFPKVTSGANRSSAERTAHPAQFPVAVIERIVQACSRPGDLILDPFLGSGTTIEAALRHGRCAVGFELNDAYIGIAEKRISRYLDRRDYASQSLFAGVGVQDD
jgi:adenine-specific DNA-methyltransferase